MGPFLTPLTWGLGSKHPVESCLTVRHRLACQLSFKILQRLPTSGGPITKVMSESESAKQAAVNWIHEQMDRHGVTFDDLVEAGCFAEHEANGEGAEAEAPAEVAPAPTSTSTRTTPIYRNAMGQTWDGIGEYPDWLQRAVNAGQSIDFYRVD